MLGWMIYCRDDAEKNKSYIQWFQEEGKLLGMRIELKILEEFGDFKALDEAESLPNFALNRSRNWKIAKALEVRGVWCVNSAEVSRLSNNKWKTYQYFHQYKIPMLPTWGMIVDNDLVHQKSCGYPLVAKSVDGHGGAEVFWVEDVDHWGPVLKALKGREIILQRPSTKPGQDLRIFVLGKEVMAAVLRESTLDFRANYSLGGKIRLVELTDYQKELVENICSVMPLEWGGIDLLFDSDKVCYLNEVEDAVGSRSLSKLSNINVAQRVLQHIKEKRIENQRL